MEYDFMSEDDLLDEDEKDDRMERLCSQMDDYYPDRSHKLSKGRLSKRAIKERGWSDLMIRSILREPDIKVKNPHGPYPICLYSLVRVERAEETEQFQEMNRRRKASHKTGKTEIGNRKSEMAEMIAKARKNQKEKTNVK